MKNKIRGATLNTGSKHVGVWELLNNPISSYCLLCCGSSYSFKSKFKALNK